MGKIKSFTTDQSCQDYINNLYKDVSGYIGYELNEKERAQKQKIFLTYGEILYPGINAMITNLDINDNDVFYDLGSGIGKVALQVFLKTSVKKACGIEASDARHRCAEKIYKSVKKEYSELFVKERELESIQGNFLLHPIQEATIIFCDSVCFSEEVLKDIGAILNDCSKLKHVISSKPIPLEKLSIAKTLELECSWQVHTRCYLYSSGT
jgi:hypothetical protein